MSEEKSSLIIVPDKHKLGISKDVKFKKCILNMSIWHKEGKAFTKEEWDVVNTTMLEVLKSKGFCMKGVTKETDKEE